MRVPELILSCALAIPSLAAAAPNEATSDQLAAGESLTGWDKVSWGQTKDEIKKAYPFRLKDRDEVVLDKQGKPFLRPGLWSEPMLLENIPTRVQFEFGETTKGLNVIRIETQGSFAERSQGFHSRACLALRSSLLATYGPPKYFNDDAKGGSWTRSWHFRHTGFGLHLMRNDQGDVMCRLRYYATGIAPVEVTRPP